jgi:hypothetical protein
MAINFSVSVMGAPRCYRLLCRVAALMKLLTGRPLGQYSIDVPL